jgi:hypothetical protein
MFARISVIQYRSAAWAYSPQALAEAMYGGFSQFVQQL